MNDHLFRFAVVTLLAVVMIAGRYYLVYSCGPGFDYERYRISYVDPDLLSDSLYQTLYRTILREHQKDVESVYSIQPEFQARDWPYRINENVRDWEGYFNHQVDPESVRALIYGVDSLLADRIKNELVKGNTPSISDTIVEYEGWDAADTFRYSQAFNWIIRNHDLQILEYLSYMSRCSRVAVAPDSIDLVNGIVLDRPSLIAEGLCLHERSTSDFLRDRYAFQVVRLARYAGLYQRAVDFYDSLLAPVRRESPVKYWALQHVAAARMHLGDSIAADYDLSRVFEHSEGNRQIAVREFRGGRPERWQQVYQMAKNNHERAILWMLRGLKQQGLDFTYLAKMHRLDPASPFLSIALMRELHQVESFLYDDSRTRPLYPDVDYGDDYRYLIMASEVDTTAALPPGSPMAVQKWDTLWKFDPFGTITEEDRYYWGRTLDELKEEDSLIYAIPGRPYVSAFRTFLLQVIQKGDVPEPGLWNMIAAYVDMMDGDFEMADECLASATEARTTDPNLHQQINLLRLIRTMQQNGTDLMWIDKEMTSALCWMEGQQQKNTHSKFDHVVALIGQKYLNEDDVPRAILAFNLAHDFGTWDQLIEVYATHTDLEALQNLIESGGENWFDEYMIASFPFRRNALLDVRGTRLMCDGEFGRALALYRKIPDSYWMSPMDSLDQTTAMAREYMYTNNGFRYVDADIYSRSMTSRLDTVDFTARFIPSDDTSSSTGYSFDREYRLAFSPQNQKHGELTFNRKTFVRRVVQLMGETRRHPEERDSLLLQLGNLFFNLKHWPTTFLPLCQDHWDRVSNPSAYPYNNVKTANRMIRADATVQRNHSRAFASLFYRELLTTTNSPELAAHAAYMMDLAAKSPTSENSHSCSFRTPPQDKTGYELLMTRYRDTERGAAILSQCQTYKRFMREEDEVQEYFSLPHRVSEPWQSMFYMIRSWNEGDGRE